MSRLSFAVAVVAVAAALAGCSSDRSGPSLGWPSSGGASAPAAPSAPPTDMAGRWSFSASGTACAMNFTGEGGIRPEGGCPGQFYTSRKWTFEGGELVMRDHTDAALAQLRLSGGGRFDGRSNNGQSVSLTR